MKFVFATNNKHKLHEITTRLKELQDPVEILSLQDINCQADIPEEQDTIEGNALQKAWWVYDRYHTDCFADDTGLAIETLNGEPGVYSARYAGENKSFDDNIDKVLLNMQGATNRKAAFITVIALIIKGKAYTFEGRVNGTILESRQGSGGFGYDPVFLPDGYTQTFAEMPLSQKNLISHRGLALKKLIAFLKDI